MQNTLWLPGQVLDSRPGARNERPVLIFGHRGASDAQAENTLAAFEAAVAQGADGVELDAQVCGSGEVVVCHDDTLERLAGVPWTVRNTPWARLRSLDVGSRLGFAQARIPLLAEVFEVLPPHVQVNVELKCDSADDGGLASAVAAWVTDHRLEGRVVVSSFNPLCLWRTAAAAPSLRRGFLLDPDRSFWWNGWVLNGLLSTYSVHPFRRVCTPNRVRAWADRGLQTIVWTVNDAHEAVRLRDMGVAACITDRPGALRAELAAINGSPRSSAPPRC